jgi:hypothetical protein
VLRIGSTPKKEILSSQLYGNEPTRPFVTRHPCDRYGQGDYGPWPVASAQLSALLPLHETYMCSAMAWRAGWPSPLVSAEENWRVAWTTRSRACRGYSRLLLLHCDRGHWVTRSENGIQNNIAGSSIPCYRKVVSSLFAHGADPVVFGS